MSTPVLKIKVLPKTVLKGNIDARFPARVNVSGFLTLLKQNGIYLLGTDYELIPVGDVLDPTLATLVVFDRADGVLKRVSLADLIQKASVGTDQHITSSGPVDVLKTAGTVRVDQTIGSPITLVMPSSVMKTNPVLISDWKGDAGTNNITIDLSAGDKFPGGLTSWKIAGDGGSLFLRPIPGVGYAI